MSIITYITLVARGSEGDHVLDQTLKGAFDQICVQHCIYQTSVNH